MKNMMLLAILLPTSAALCAADQSSPHTLWYRQSAERWTDALPIGNGRLGAMVFGGVNQEHLQLNEGTLWAGGPYHPVNPEAPAALPEVRRLIFAGQYDAAQRIVRTKMSANQLRPMPYQTLGDLFLDFGTNAASAKDYRRDLNLETALTTVSYMQDGVHFRREMFASADSQVIVIRLTADQPGKLSFTAELNTPQKATTTVESATGQTNDASLVMNGVNGEVMGTPGVLKFQARVRVLPEEGTLTVSTDKISVANANRVTLFIAASTSYKNYHDFTGDPDAINRNQIDNACTKQKRGTAADAQDALLAEHIASHKQMFSRVELNLGETDAMNLPTNERIKRFASGNDPQLAALYFQFARYLRALSADQLLAVRWSASDLARFVERFDEPEMAQ